MTVAGWFFLIFGWGVVIALSAWCIYRIATASKE